MSEEVYEDPTRRDFLYVATGAFGVVGAASVAWPFIDQMNPDASALALSTTEVDISSLEPGMSMRIMWRGKPVFIRNRTEEEVAAAKDVALADLPDQDARNGKAEEATDLARSAGEGRESLIVMVGVCTHLGCIPLGVENNGGEFGGWFCPCHGSHYDTAGRIRKGPAPENLPVPPFEFLSDNVIKIG
ncbi:MAG: ubiquinol-cytochrome c reductase iron-sulfur subunit [Hyphomicrobiales bacterium]